MNVHFVAHKLSLCFVTILIIPYIIIIVRKSGNRACITVLDRESVDHSNETRATTRYTSDYTHLRNNYTSKTSVIYQNNKLSKKRRRELVAPNNYDQLRHGSNKSHHSHVAALSFFPNGHYMASVGGKDGELLLWDLRTGCLHPSKFVSPGGMEAAARKQRRVALLTTSRTRFYDNDTSALWIARKGAIMGYSMQGGSPKQILKGHLQDVTALESMDPGNHRILSGSKDGMVMAWGQPQSAVAMGRPISEVNEDRDNW